MVQSHQLVSKHKFFDHIAYYCFGVNFNEVVWSRLCNEFELLCVYGDWMIHGWWMIDLIKTLCLINFCGSWFLQIVFLGILDEHVDVFSWILIFHFFLIFRIFYLKKYFRLVVAAPLCVGSRSRARVLRAPVCGHWTQQCTDVVWTLYAVARIGLHISVWLMRASARPRCIAVLIDKEMTKWIFWKLR